MFNQSQLKTWLIIREMALCVWVSLKEFVICELKKKNSIKVAALHLIITMLS